MQVVNATARRPAIGRLTPPVRGCALARPFVLRHMDAMSITARTAALDHLVLPTASLDAARARLGALGFTVAPTGVHPFGTANCCVYLADGTFLEPLAIAAAGACAAAVAGGNVFVARDHAFRAAWGDDGFSAIVLTSTDAAADHAAFLAEAISAGDMLTFSRPFQDASGNSDTASFRLAFAAAPGTAPFVFTCERVDAPNVERSALERHANGASAILAVTVVAADPGAAAGFFAAATDAEGRADIDGVRFPLAGGEVVIRDPGADEPPVRAAAFAYRAIVFAVADLSATRAILEANGIGFDASDIAITVAPAPGQGATFIFEERA